MLYAADGVNMVLNFVMVSVYCDGKSVRELVYGCPETAFVYGIICR